MSSGTARTQTVRLTIRQDDKISRWECGNARAYAAQSRLAGDAGASLQLCARRNVRHPAYAPMFFPPVIPVSETPRVVDKVLVDQDRT